MNKRIVLLLVSVIVVVAVIFGVREFLSYKDVAIVFKQPDIAIDIYAANGSKITATASDTSIRLKEGSYYYTPTNERYAHDKVYFTITKNETVEINPSYSKEFLSALLTQEQSTIKAILAASYSEVLPEYIISDEQLSHQGEWYSAKLIQRVSGGNEPDVYRVILKKEKTNWEVVISPRLVIAISEFKQVPEYIIRQINQPLSNEAYDLLYPV